MRLKILAAVAVLAAPVLALAGGAQAADLITNGSFTANTVSGVSAQYGGVEIDTLYNYAGTLTGWSSPSVPGYTNAFNLYFNGDYTKDADTRYSPPHGEPGQHPNVNFTGPSPDGGAFVVLDGDPNFTGPLQQTINGLTIGQTYALTFDWAAGELADRTGYNNERLDVSFGADTQSTATSFNTAAANAPGSFSGWQVQTFTFKATSASQVLSFLSVGTPAANLPPVAFLDGVSMVAIPEPAVWTMMIAGFGGLGATMRRRRRRATA